MKWIKIEDRFPPIEQMYIVYIRNKETEMKDVTTRFCGRKDEFITDEWGWEVTHWMPLPDPPKEGEA